MTSTKDGGLTFPHGHLPPMTLRDWFAGQALVNSKICSGEVPDWQLAVWFPHQTGVTREQIVARQAMNYADAMLAARTKENKDV